MPRPSNGLAGRFDRRLDRHARNRHGSSAQPIRIHRRRVYILPSRLGLYYLLLVLALYLGATNFGSNLTHALTYLLVAIGLIGMRETHRQLVGLEVSALPGSARFAGEPASFQVQVRTPGNGARPGLRLRPETGAPPLLPQPEPGGIQGFELSRPSRQRGWLRLGGVRLETSYPLGLFRAWCWLGFDQAVLIYPPPLPLPTPLRSQLDASVQPVAEIDPEARGEDELSHLRGYQRGDPPRRIAWKALARGGPLLTKHFAAAPPQEIWLDWQALPPAPDETRLGWLCGAVLEAERQGSPYALRLPGEQIEPGLGPRQRHRCLRALALYRTHPRAPA